MYNDTNLTQEQYRIAVKELISEGKHLCYSKWTSKVLKCSLIDIENKHIEISKRELKEVTPDVKHKERKRI